MKFLHLISVFFVFSGSWAFSSDLYCTSRFGNRFPVVQYALWATFDANTLSLFKAQLSINHTDIDEGDGIAIASVIGTETPTGVVQFALGTDEFGNKASFSAPIQTITNAREFNSEISLTGGSHPDVGLVHCTVKN